MGQVTEELEAAVERGRELHAFQQEHGGQLPEQYADVSELITESRAA
ncbi:MULTISPECIES: hypothetical protein [Streptomyces]|nr:hypothetical protein [Streptomyces sp. st140]